MKTWEAGLAHFVHFLLYAAMILMPLTGWATLSAKPPAGSAGWTAAKTAGVPHLPPPPSPEAAAQAIPGEGVPGTITLWWTVPAPLLSPLERIGRTAGGIEPQKELHDQFFDWHVIGGYIMLLLMLLHVAGALKHQFIDRHVGLARMGIGRLPQSADSLKS
jgi:cytochrome b561